MSNLTNLSNMSNSSKKGGYESLVVYHLAVIIYDLTQRFCKKYLNAIGEGRTREQMIQAARSGKQNIVEGSLEKSTEGNIKLTGVARASFGELIEDYKDFLRNNDCEIWDKNNPGVLSIRSHRINLNQSNLTNLSNLSNMTNLKEDFANMMITLIYKETYMLDHLLYSQEQKFIKEGGFRENLFRKRLNYKNRTL